MPERYIQPLRLLIQSVFMLLSLLAVIRFSLFLSAATAGVEAVNRPAVMDAFLPLTAMDGMIFWIKGGGISPLHPAAVIILLAAIIISFLFRRSFCSWVCLLGTVSEWLWKLGFSKNARNVTVPHRFDLLLRAFKYLFLLYLLFSALFIPQRLLQERLITGSYADAGLLHLLFHPTITVFVIISAFVISSIFIRNPFCRYLCPFGAMFSIFALASPTAVQRNRKKCVSCGVCNQACPSGIDVMRSSRVNSAECLGCWRCISYCRVNQALYMGVASKWRMVGVLFAVLLLVTFWGTVTVGKLTGHWDSTLTASDYRIEKNRPYQQNNKR